MSPKSDGLDHLDQLFYEAGAHRREMMWGQRHMIRKDPITLIVTSVVGALEAGAAAVGIGAAVGGGAGVAGIGAAAGAAAVGTGISLGWAGSLALSIGLSYAANALQRASMKDKGGFAVGVNSPEIRLNVRQEVPARRRAYGRPLMGGALFFEDSIPPYYYRGFLLSDGPVDGIEEFYNSQNLINLDATRTHPLTAPYLGNLEVSFRNGSRDQLVDPILIADFPSLGADFRQRGVATLVVKGNYGADAEEFETLWGAVRRPNPFVKLRGVPVYDPRDPTQVLPTDPTDPEDYATAQATWKWSRNATLIIADYLWWQHGGRVPLDRMKWDEIAESADWDDGKIETKAGELIPRHTIDGIVTAGQAPAQILTTMLSANRGFIARRGGHVTVISSQPQTPIRTITDEWILGGFDVRRTAPKSETLNRVRCRLIDPRQEWQMVDGPILTRDDLIEEDGSLYEGTVQFPWTERHERAQRLQKAALLDTRIGRAVTLSLDLRALGIEAGDVVRFFSEVAPHANGIYRVQEVSFNYLSKTIELTMVEYDSSIDTNWVAADDEQDFEIPDLEAA